MNPIEFEKILNDHDQLIAAAGLTARVGMEPTFTRRFMHAPEWLSEALGEDKLEFAQRLLCEIHRRWPGGVVLRTLGRQYAGEERPRWCLGYYRPRDPACLLYGPKDPLIAQHAFDDTEFKAVEESDVESLWRRLCARFNQHGWQCSAFRVYEGLRYRLLLRCDGIPPIIERDNSPQLARDSVHVDKIPLDGLKDQLAANGDFLFCLDCGRANNAQDGVPSLVIELPEAPEVAMFMRWLQVIDQAMRESKLEGIVLQGFSPPVDVTVDWTTITPDPAVIEINQAPADDAAMFYRMCELSFGAAHETGLDPYRLHYNGVVSDSGGGGQFTLGGNTALTSPFFVYPELLPRLVRYINAHPALSYWFAPPSVGSSSQSPRSDEGLSDSFRELALSLEQLDKARRPDPEFIWRSLSPFLVDPSGNPHRSELNIEKLWNPYLPGRGCLGLVEFRAFRMTRGAQTAAAIAVLLRSLLGMLLREAKVQDLVAHGARLHDRFALPFNLQKDLRTVFEDLRQSGFPIHDALQERLLGEPIRAIATHEYLGCRIEVQQALEFWPLVGDVASQERGGSRLVDASTARLQISLHASGPEVFDLENFELWIDGYRIPLRAELDEHPVRLMGLRYRNFMPAVGLHPGVLPRQSIVLVLAHPAHRHALEITYHEWQPEGLAYPGLPEDLGDAEQRRSERLTTRTIAFDCRREAKPIPDCAISEYCLDLRRLPA